MIAFKYHFVILLITIIRVRSASIRREPARETVVDYVYEIRDDPVVPVEEEAEVVAPGEDYDWKKYQEQELIFAPGSADELRVRPDGTATFTQQEVKRFHRTTGNGAEEDRSNGLDKVVVMDNRVREMAAGNLAENPDKQDNSKPITESTTTTVQPERVKREEDIGTTLSPKPVIAAGEQSGSLITTNPTSDLKLAVAVQSEQDTNIFNKRATSGSSSDQEKSTTSSPVTSPAPVKVEDINPPTETVKTKKSVNPPAVLAEHSSLDVADASDNLLEKLDKGTEAKNANLVSKVSPVEQTNAAPASTAAANGSTGEAAPSSSTITPETTQAVTNAPVPAASEVESKNLTKRHEGVLTTSTEPPFEEVDDLKTTTPKTIVVSRNTGNDIIAEVVPNASTANQVGTAIPVTVPKVKSDFAPAQSPEEVTKAPSPTTTILRATALAKAVMLAESLQSEITAPPSIPSTEKVPVASAAAAEVPILRFGFPEISRREPITVNQAEAQVPIVIAKRETGKPPSHLMEAEVTLVDSEDVEEAPANNIASEANSTVAPAKQEEKEDSGEEEVEEPDQAPANKLSNNAASHAEEEVAEEAPTDQESKDSLSKLVKKQTSSHGKHFKGEEVEAEEENMAPGNKVAEESGEDDEETTTLKTVGITAETVTKKQDSPEEEEEEDTTPVDAVTENDEEDDDEEEEPKETVKRDDSETTQEMVDDSQKNIAEGLSLAKGPAKRGDSGGGAGIEGGGIAEGGDLNQSEGLKSKVLVTDISPGKNAKSGSVEEDDEDGESDDEEDDDDDKSESPGESTFLHHGKHSTGRKRREISDKKFVGEENVDKAALVNQILHRTKRSSDMREMEVDGQKVYVDTPLEFSAPGSSFDGIADGRHLLMNGVPRKTRQTGSGYDAFPQNVGSDKFPHPFCDLERDTGNICPGVRRGVFLEQFFYDSETNRCSHFVYNGCGGNANRFSTLWECNQFCGKQNIHMKRQD